MFEVARQNSHLPGKSWAEVRSEGQKKSEVVSCFRVGGEKIRMEVDSSGSPSICAGNSSYRSIEKLLGQYPDLLKSSELARVVAFMAAGLQYEVIEDIEGFQRQYRLMQEGKQQTLPLGSSCFDISLLHPPAFESEAFVFFVKDRCGIPYQVRCSTPLTDDSPIEFEVLPYCTAADGDS